jgi:hypothetical protein
MNRIFPFEHEGRSTLGFDTGLDSRAFAQARLAQFITKPGLIVFPDGKTEIWKAEGVTELAGSMVIWGTGFAGNRLDLLVENGTRDEALEALVSWIKALLFSGKTTVSPQPYTRPSAALIADNGAYPRGTVLFCPEQLALRCVQAGGADASNANRYVHPDLTGDEAAAFSAAALLYRILAGTPPFSAGEETVLHEDMRECSFLPPRLACPGLDEKLAALMERGLRQTRTGSEDSANDGGTALLGQLAGIKNTASLFHALSAEASRQLTEEKERYLKRKNITVNSRRFVTRNRAIILGFAAAVVIAALVAGSIIKSKAERPTTKGMDSQTVVQSYYGAFGELDHTLMDACRSGNAGKGDVDMVVNLYVISKVRQAYETGGASNFMSAAEWKVKGGGPAASQVFGVTDLRVEHLTGGEETEETRWRAVYTLWLPWQHMNTENAPADSAPAAEEAAGAETLALPQGIRHTDVLTLQRKRGNWRITAIERVTESPQASD